MDGERPKNSNNFHFKYSLVYDIGLMRQFKLVAFIDETIIESLDGSHIIFIIGTEATLLNYWI